MMSALTREIEVKFSLTPAQLRQWEQSMWWQTAEPVAIEPLDSLYFDTPDLVLHAHKTALRLRKTPHGWWQTLKTVGKFADGLHHRVEIETPVTSPQLAQSVLQQAQFSSLFTPAVCEHLSLCFETTFIRERRYYRTPECVLEFAIDRGQIRAGALALPVLELECELIDGEPRAMANLVRDMAIGLGWQADSVSKAQRGFALVIAQREVQGTL